MPVLFSIEQRIPWCDVDLARIVYFPRYFSYFEMAELEWVRQQGLSYEGLLNELEVWLPRVAAHCNYRAPARLAELITIEMRRQRIGRKSFTYRFDAYRLPDRVHLVDGYVTIATVSRGGFEPTPIPERLVHMLEELEPSEET
jgi:YbgC/YbaW family acyl-CoA thioester hydrolase